jgi:hypothetical protein
MVVGTQGPARQVAPRRLLGALPGLAHLTSRRFPRPARPDCEIWNGDSSTKPGKADIKSFCDRLKAKMPKLRPIVYASAGEYGNSLSGLGYPLWNASATIAGQTTCDANAYRGTPAQLTSLLAPGREDDVELTDKYGDEAWPSRTVRNRLKDDAMLRDVLWGDVPGTKVADLDPASPLAKLIAVPGQLEQLAAAVAQLPHAQTTAALDDLADKTPEEIARVLKDVLGDKAGPVAAALQTPA